MADVDVEINEHESDEQRDDVAEGKLIDAAVDAGKSAGTAENHAEAAEQHAQAAATATAVAADSAAQAQDGADRSEQILSRLNELTEQNARLLAAQAAMHSNDHAADTLDALDDEPGEPIEVEPEREHFLTKKWNFGGLFGDRK